MVPGHSGSTYCRSLTPLQNLLCRRWRPQWVCRARRAAQAQAHWRFITTTRSFSERRRGKETTLEKPYYITTPIFYVNAAPHVGHMYTMILADVLKRWQQLKCREAVLLTGTDEHGMKVQHAAAKANTDPKTFCDQGAEVFKELASAAGVGFDRFMRTTDPDHCAAVEYAWEMLNSRGYIYESTHEGWYSVSDEAFYPAKDVRPMVEPQTGRKFMASIETHKEVEWTSERNYRFRLSAFRDRLLEWYRQNPGWIVPQTRMDDVVQHVTAGLEDLSVSRPTDRLSWGIRVPTDSSQTIYVWLDALLNYASAAGFPFTPDREHEGGWPADVHVIGKDIVRFHCVYWPAFLMALDLPLPKRILTHAHWTLGGEKMSKSTGNVVNPFYALERFGVDPLRFFLIQEGGIVNDAKYNNEDIIVKYRKSLQGGLGNLASRVLRGKGWDVHRAVSRFTHSTNAGKIMLIDHNRSKEDELRRAQQICHGQLRSLRHRMDMRMADLKVGSAITAMMEGVFNANAMLQKASPWLLVEQLKGLKSGDASEESEEQAADIELNIDRTIFLTAEALRIVAILSQPLMPDKATLLLDMLGVAKDRRTWEWSRVGHDKEYGKPFVDLGSGQKGALFPTLPGDIFGKWPPPGR